LTDQYLTKAKVKRVVTNAGGSQIVQTNAEKSEAGHYEAFGPAPVAGDFLSLEFQDWFEELQGQFYVTLFEDDLPSRKPLSTNVEAFEPSANIQWQYRSDAAGTEDEWSELKVIRDETLGFSQSGNVVFSSPTGSTASKYKELRALLLEGQFEIPPRIVAIRTNTVQARQVETIVNEDLGKGLGTPDQFVRLKKWPLFISNEVDDGPLNIGEVLDWQALSARLKDVYNIYASPMKDVVLYLVERLQAISGSTLNVDTPDCCDLLKGQEYGLAQAFDTLLSDPDLYQPEIFK